MQVTAKDMASQHGHGNEKSVTTLTTITLADVEYDLRLCGAEEGAFFEWIDCDGTPGCDVFYEIESIEAEANRFAAFLNLDTPRCG